MRFNMFSIANHTEHHSQQYIVRFFCSLPGSYSFYACLQTETNSRPATELQVTVAILDYRGPKAKKPIKAPKPAPPHTDGYC